MKSNKALYRHRVQIPKIMVNNEKEEIELDLFYFFATTHKLHKVAFEF